MTPDVLFVLLSTLLTVACYLLWLVERLPRVRFLLGVLAILTFVVACFFHDAMTSRESAEADHLWGTEQRRPLDLDAQTS